MDGFTDTKTDREARWDFLVLWGSSDSDGEVVSSCMALRYEHHRAYSLIHVLGKMYAFLAACAPLAR
jgi:hypothetical protein